MFLKQIMKLRPPILKSKILKFIKPFIKKMENMDLKILFWNARSIAQRKEDLVHLLTGIDVFVCVETWLSANEA